MTQVQVLTTISSEPAKTVQGWPNERRWDIETRVKITFKIPERLNDRLRAHRKSSGITTRHFATEAIEAALDKAGVPQVVKRPKPAASA